MLSPLSLAGLQTAIMTFASLPTISSLNLQNTVSFTIRDLSNYSHRADDSHWKIVDSVAIASLLVRVGAENLGVRRSALDFIMKLAEYRKF